MEINELRLFVAGSALFTSIVFFALGVRILLWQKKLKKYGIPTTASVIKVSLSNRPTVEFQTERGLIRSKSLIGGSSTFGLKKDTVKIRNVS